MKVLELSVAKATFTKMADTALAKLVLWDQDVIANCFGAM